MVDALVVTASVVSPVTLSVLCVEMAPAAVVVAFPPTHKAPAMDTAPVVEAVAREERPVTPSVPVAVTFAVEMFVLMVVAAWAILALMKTTARAKMTVRVVLPRPFKYILMLVIIIHNYFKRIIKKRDPSLELILALQKKASFQRWG